jgi:hypothetical protein
VAVRPDAGFFAAWTEGFLGAENVWGRSYTPAAIPLAPAEIGVNLIPPYGDQAAASADADASGTTVVVWESQNDIFSPHWTILARRFNSLGIPLGGPVEVSQTTTGEQRHPVVAADPQGNFVVAWQANGRDGSGNAILARRFDAAGNPLGNEFLVNQFTAGAQQRPAVDRDAQGRFAIAWQSDGQDGSLWGIYARRYDAAGNALGNEFRVNTTTFWFQERPGLALTPDGRLIVVWQSGHEGDYGVFGQRYDAAGVPVGAEFRVNTVGPGHQLEPAVAAQPSGGFVVTWAQQESTSAFTDVWARIYPPFGAAAGDLIFADGFETGDLARWSSVNAGGGDLGMAAPGLAGTYRLQGVVNDEASLFVQDDTPANEARYRARFQFDPNGFDPGEGQAHLRTRVFIAFAEPSRRQVTIVLRRLLGQYAVMARVRLDDGTVRDSGFFAIDDAPTTVELDWVRATADSSFDGRFQLWINGVSRSTMTNLDTHQFGVDFARMGALSVKPGATGVLFWDSFESRRLNYIGPPN